MWAFDFASGVDEPPVAALDTEGQYLWIGIDLAEVLRQDGRWTVSTQFLPQLADLHADYYSLEMGKRDDASWLADDRAQAPCGA